MQDIEETRGANRDEGSVGLSERDAGEYQGNIVCKSEWHASVDPFVLEVDRVVVQEPFL